MRHSDLSETTAMHSINKERLLADLQELAQIGATADGGVSRVAFSEEDLKGRSWFKKRVEEAGLKYSIDGAGNQSALLVSDPPSDKHLLFGSHLDSVPNGGQYDGALGTLAAFEALRTLKEQGYRPPMTLEVINFTSEENVILLMMGSRAVAGKLKAEDLDRAKLGPAEFDARLAALGISRESILAAKRKNIAAWLELHIEQATVLEESRTDIGVVTAIVGIRNFKLRFRGQAAHAGTKPMAERRDALWGAAEYIGEARKLVMEAYTPGVMNVGQVYVEPGAFNIVPAEVVLDMEFRHGSEEKLNKMQAELIELQQRIAAKYDLVVLHESIPSVEPSKMDERVISALEDAADSCGLSHCRMLSFAGHDTQSMSSICPSAMFFVPSIAGVSHAPEEFTNEQDCINGANVILNAVHTLAEELS